MRFSLRGGLEVVVPGTPWCSGGGDGNGLSELTGERGDAGEKEPDAVAECDEGEVVVCRVGEHEMYVSHDCKVRLDEFSQEQQLTLRRTCRRREKESPRAQAKQ